MPFLAYFGDFMTQKCLELLKDLRFLEEKILIPSLNFTWKQNAS